MSGFASDSQSWFGNLRGMKMRGLRSTAAQPDPAKDTLAATATCGVSGYHAVKMRGNSVTIRDVSGLVGFTLDAAGEMQEIRLR